MKIAVVIPCFDVAAFCEQVIYETIPFANHIVLVDDGSTDGTGKILDAFQRKYPANIHLLRFSKNRGKGFALIEGLRYIIENFDCDVLLTVDGDGQHRPSDIPNLANLISQGADLGIGERKFSQMPPYSRFANILITLILHLRYSNAPWDTQSGLRSFSKEYAKEVLAKVPGGRYEMEFQCILLALKKGKKIASCPIPTIYFNKNIHSHFRKLRDTLRILKTLFIHLFTFGKN